MEFKIGDKVKVNEKKMYEHFERRLKENPKDLTKINDFWHLAQGQLFNKDIKECIITDIFDMENDIRHWRSENIEVNNLVIRRDWVEPLSFKENYKQLREKKYGKVANG